MQIKTTSRTVLRRMLRDCDKKLTLFDAWNHFGVIECLHNGKELFALDARRREIRRRLKERRDG